MFLEGSSREQEIDPSYFCKLEPVPSKLRGVGAEVILADIYKVLGQRQ